MLAVLLAPLITVSFFSLLPAPASAADLANGGFETGDFTSWTLRREVPTPTINSTVFHSGAYAAQLGGYPLPSVYPWVGDSQIMQTVAVPATGTTTLDFEWYPYSDEAASLGTEGCMVYDWQDVLVYDETGSTLGAGLGSAAGLLMHTCSNAQAWQHRSFDLTPWAGSTVALVFGVRQDDSVVTTMMVDDIAVTTSDPIDDPVPSSMIVSHNGLEWVWASPTAADYNPDGVLVGKDGFGFATPEQWALRPPVSAFGPSVPWTWGSTATLCAAPWFDKSFDHCDWDDAVAGYYGSALSGQLPAGPDGTTPMGMVAETWLVRVPDSGDVETSTGLASNHNPSVFGQPVELTATVTGSTVPTGTVEFWEGATKLGQDGLNGSGVATLTVSDFSVGSHNVIAKYVPDTGFTASESDVLAQVVDKAATTTVINSVTPAHPTYGQTLSFDTTVAPVAPGDGTPSGDVTYKVNKFAGTPDATGYVDFDPASDLLPAGTHHVEAYYAGDDNFTGSQSNAFVVEVDQAETTVAYLGDYLAILGNDFTVKANVDNPVGSCETGRAVTFTLDNGVDTPIVITATSGAGGAVSKTVSTTGWPLGQYDVLVEVAETANCTAADNAEAMDVVTVASPGDAATGGGWYFWKDAGAGKRVNFGFTVSKQADNSYKGSLLLMNQGVWRLKGNLDSYTRTDAAGQAGGTGTLYQWVLADPGDPTTGSWQNPRTVSFKIAFTDEAAGRAKGKKSTVVDKFALTNLSVRGATLPVSGLKDLKGGNIVLR
jgi:hypothetical protein